MSTVAEIEAAVKALPREQQEELFAFLAEQIGQFPAAPSGSEDAFAHLIGAYAGPHEATGRRAEEILYGSEGSAPLRFWTLARLLALAREFPATEAPTDGAAQHDHYLYGLPRRS